MSETFEKTWRIKPLEWRVITKSSQWTEYAADTLLGTIQISGYTGMKMWLYLPHCSRGWHDSAEIAKSIAEQWYLDRLLPALTPAPAIAELIEAATRALDRLRTAQRQWRGYANETVHRDSDDNECSIKEASHAEADLYRLGEQAVSDLDTALSNLKGT